MRCLYTPDSDHAEAGRSVVAISYRDSNRSEQKPSRLGPLLVVIATIAGLYVFVPETTSALERAMTSMIALPRF